MKTVFLKYRGDKSAVGRTVDGFIIGKLSNGAVIDINGIAIGKYERLHTDDGPYKDWQEIEIQIELER